MEIKQLRSFTAVVRYGSFTKAAEKTYLSQPAISTHIRALEEELQVRLIVRDTKNIRITPKGWELYECAVHMLELQDNLLQKWSEETKKIIQLGASTIPSAYILPEILPLYGKMHQDIYFVVQQSDSSKVVKGLLNGIFDIGMIGMECRDESLHCIPFYRDRMVLITPVNEHFLSIKEKKLPVSVLLHEPMILREKGSGSQKSADRFLESMDIAENDLKITARVNDQESIKNLVAGGLGISIISERAVKNFVAEKRLLAFDLEGNTARRDLYLIFSKQGNIPGMVRDFTKFVQDYYRASQGLQP